MLTERSLRTLCSPRVGADRSGSERIKDLTALGLSSHWFLTSLVRATCGRVRGGSFVASRHR